jgi:hypothetical protein
MAIPVDKYMLSRAILSQTSPECCLACEKPVGFGRNGKWTTYLLEGDRLFGQNFRKLCQSCYSKHLTWHRWATCEICFMPFPCTKTTMLSKALAQFACVERSRVLPARCNHCIPADQVPQDMKAGMCPTCGEVPKKADSNPDYIRIRAWVNLKLPEFTLSCENCFFKTEEETCRRCHLPMSFSACRVLTNCGRLLELCVSPSAKDPSLCAHCA